MPKDVGLRYLLPVLALWTAAAACGLVTVLGTLQRAARQPGPGGRGHAARRGGPGTAWSFPRSIAWTAWPFRPGYAVATDSDVDWGQGLYALSAWSASQDPWVTYFGPHGITTAAIPGARPLLGPRRLGLDSAGWPPR